MATITAFVDGTVSHEAPGGIMGISQNILDFSVTNVTAADVVQAVKVKAGQTVVDVQLEVLTAAGATCTATVGDATSANGWDASADLNAAAHTVTSSLKGTDGYAYGKSYAADDTIDLVMGHTNAVAKILVTVLYYTNRIA